MGAKPFRSIGGRVAAVEWSEANPVSRRRKEAAALVAWILATAIVASTLHAEPLTLLVDTTADEATATACTAAPGDCSLRGALIRARDLPERTTVRLPASTYELAQPNTCAFQTLQFGSSSVVNSVTLCIVGPVTLLGDGAATTVIDAGRRDRVLVAGSGHPIEIRGVTIRNGWQRGGSLYGGGGAINAAGELRIVDSVLTENSADVNGGSIYNSGTLELLRTTVTRSVSAADGGGILNDSQSVLSLADSLVSDNVSGPNGGGIMNYQGSVTLSGTTVSGNRARSTGGGLWSQGGTLVAHVRATNTTMSGNKTVENCGGGFYNGFRSVAELRNATIVGNRAGDGGTDGIGGGICNTEGADLTLQNSLVAGNSSSRFAPDCYDGGRASTVTSAGYNLIQTVDDECTLSGDPTGNVTGQNAGLGALADNGGFAPTHALVEGSPALDAGSPESPGTGGAACAPSDQRGLLRPMGARCDIGAFERSGAFALRSIVPARGGSTGSVVVRIAGDAFVEDTSVKLVRGAAVIPGTAVHAEEGGSSLGASFDLAGRAMGTWDVVVTQPDGAMKTLPAGFRVEAGVPAALWVNVLGRNQVRAGRVNRYTILYGNRGNVDAQGVPLTLVIRSNYALAALFEVADPPAQPGQVPTNWGADAPVTVRAGTSGQTNVPLLLPVVPAGFTGALRITLTVPVDATDEALYVFVSDPFLDPALSPAVLAEFVGGAEAYAERNLGVTVPPALLPELERYVRTQLQLAATLGREALTVNAGTSPQVFSLVQFQIDAARFIAARVTAGAALRQPTLDLPSLRTLAGRLLGALVTLLLPREAHADPCTGKILKDGENCGDSPNPIPPPDKGPEKPLTPAECADIPRHEVSQDGTRCQPKEPSGCSTIQCLPNPLAGTDPRCTCYPIGPRTSIDPNDKLGPQGGGQARFTAQRGALAYSILFENLPAATAPAAEVEITDLLDISKLDPGTFELGPITFGPTTLRPPPGSSEFRGAVDLRPTKNLIVLVDAGIDVATGLASWQFTSIDPALGGPSDDPDVGFLPPNVSPPEGDGSVLFTIRPRASTSSGTTICNEASIVFDVNAPIRTPEWCNTFDFATPSSQVISATANAALPSAAVVWSGSDPGSGIESYSVFVSESGGPYSAWLADTVLTSSSFTGKPGTTYGLYVTARDQGGNVESPPATADAVVKLAGSLPADADGDGIPNAQDECPVVANPDQLDVDLDGVGDACDNCQGLANANQRDADQDGFGSLCDPDLDQNGIVNFSDLGLFKAKFLRSDANADFDGSGVVNFADLARLKLRFLKAPGPSACAGLGGFACSTVP